MDISIIYVIQVHTANIVGLVKGRHAASLASATRNFASSAILTEKCPLLFNRAKKSEELERAAGGGRGEEKNSNTQESLHLLDIIVWWY